MSVLLTRILGGATGWGVNHYILLQTLAKPTSGHDVIGQAMWFWGGGWIILLGWHVFGILIGFFGIVPFINSLGTIAIPFWQHRQQVRERKNSSSE